MVRRLAVARALFARPSLLIMDEPLAGLDAASAVKLYDDLRAIIKRENVTVFVTTHRLAAAERFCSHIGVLSQGTMLAVGTPDELQQRDDVASLEITGSGFDDDVVALLARRREVVSIQSSPHRLLVTLRDRRAQTAPLVSLLIESGAEVEEVHRDRASLTDVFLHLTESERLIMPIA